MPYYCSLCTWSGNARLYFAVNLSSSLGSFYKFLNVPEQLLEV